MEADGSVECGDAVEAEGSVERGGTVERPAACEAWGRGGEAGGGV